MTVYDKRLARSHDDILEAVAAAEREAAAAAEATKRAYDERVSGLNALLALRRTNDQRKALALQLESLSRLNESSNKLHESLDLREVLDAVESVCRGLFHGFQAPREAA